MLTDHIKSLPKVEERAHHVFRSCYDFLFKDFYRTNIVRMYLHGAEDAIGLRINFLEEEILHFLLDFKGHDSAVYRAHKSLLKAINPPYLLDSETTLIILTVYYTEFSSL